MRKISGLYFLLMYCIFAGTLPALYAQDKSAENKNISNSEKISVLEEEIEKLKLKKATKTYTSIYGMGPAASAVYESADGLSIGGYAEIVGSMYKTPYKKGIGDAERFVLYTGYHFNNWLVFNSEVELEHGGFERAEVVSDVDFAGRSAERSTIEKGKAGLEFAYLDFQLLPQFNIRAGLNLVPIGITNFMHEPTTFYSVYRPVTETTIIPTTWKELGVIFHGEFFGGKLGYRTGVMSGLDGRKFTASSWIGEDGSYRGSQAELRDLAYIFNFDFKPTRNISLGGSYYLGGAGQGNVPRTGLQDRYIYPASVLTGQAALDFQVMNTAKTPQSAVMVNISEGHAQYESRRFEFRGLAVRGWMNENDSRSLNRTNGENIGRVAEGGYIEAGVNLLSFTSSEKKLLLFVRNERLNTQRATNTRSMGGAEDVTDMVCAKSSSCKTTEQMQNGNQDLGIISSNDPGRELYGVKGVADGTNDRSITTLGLAFFPHPNVVIKMEYARNHSRSKYYRDTEILNPDNNQVDQINFGIGLIF